MIVLLLAGSAHYCFYRGQTTDLYQIELYLKAEDVVINAESVCEAIGIPGLNASMCKIAVSADPEPDILLKQGYWDTIKTIWDILSPDNYYIKGWKHPWETRLGAILVFCFSGLWPHLKLILLQISWYCPMQPKLRRSFCFWLDMFGKWSLLDVFVISLTVALFDLTWNLDVDQTVGNIVFNLPPLLENTVLTNPERTKDFIFSTCKMINEYDNDANRTICANVFNKVILADIGLDVDLLENLYEMLTNQHHLSGLISIGFKAVSQSGVYWFSAGVSLSLLAGVFVDIVDDRLTSRIRRSKRNAAPPKSIVEDATEPPLCTNKSIGCGVVEAITLILGILFALGIFFLPTVRRKADGALPELVTALTNSSVDQTYNLIDIINGITSGGGGNPFLQKDSIVFLIIGPLLLLGSWAAAIVVHRPFCASRLPGAKDVIGVVLKIFATATAWEVLMIAELVMMLEMPQLTASLLDSPRQLAYIQYYMEALGREGFNKGILGFNLEIDFTAWWYVLVLVGGIFAQVATFALTLVLQRDTHHSKGNGDYRLMGTATGEP